MASIEIRDATTDDAEDLAPLLETLGYPARPEAIASRLRTLQTTDPTSRVIVATRNGEIVGFATLHTTPVLHRPTGVGRITGIAVRPAVKGTVSAARWCVRLKHTSSNMASGGSR
jgi:N-acetylglutamate synthase-like GNAT family acetyltransferase